MKGASQRLQAAFTENAVLKVLAFVLALTMVLVKSEDKVSDLEFDIPVALEFPENRVLTTPPLDKVRVTVRGSYAKLKKFDPKSVPSISMNLSGFEDSQETFESKQLRVPPGLSVTRIKPSAMVVRFEERTVADVVVRPITEGQPQADYLVGEVSVAPKTVKVIGAKSVVESLEYVRTQPISLVGRTQTFSRNTRLAAAPFLAKYAVTGQRVEVRVLVNEKVGERVIRDVPVHVLQDEETESFEVSPSKISLRISGKMPTIRRVEKGLLDAYVDARGVTTTEMFRRPVIVESPEGVTVEEKRPEEVSLVRQVPEIEEEQLDLEEEQAGGAKATPKPTVETGANQAKNGQPPLGGQPAEVKKPKQKPVPEKSSNSATGVE